MEMVTMDIRHTFKRSAAMLAGMMMLVGASGYAYAEESTTAPSTEAATADSTEEATTQPTTAP
ncbi:MAG TPA: hypothetical protein PLY43_05285, partial [Ruminococcus sp.]|nr:hypothetical protein [Ruminococcus sp.]